MRKKIFNGMCLSTLITCIGAAVAFAVFFSYSVIVYLSVAVAVIFVMLVIIFNYTRASRIAREVTDDISKIDFDSPDDIDTYDELASFIRTILRQKNQIESQINELERQASTTQSIFENMQEGFIMLDKSGAVITANHRARAFFDAKDDYEGKNINYLTRNTSLLDKVKAALQGHSGQMLLESDQINQISFIPSADQGAILLITNITERQLAEKMRREFSANVTHELNTPLTCIAGFAEILSKGQVEMPDVVHFGEKIKNESYRMIDLVENIIFLSKLDEMDGRDAYTNFDLAKVAREAAGNLQQVADALEIELSLSDSPCNFDGNRQLIHSLFTNLIANAIQYNKPRGSVKIAVSRKKQFAYINVTDTGIGIPKDEQFRVFERFYRVDPSRNTQFGGAGLGLSIVKNIIRYHEGTIEMESEPGEGTSVFIKLPVRFGVS